MSCNWASSIPRLRSMRIACIIWAQELITLLAWDTRNPPHGSLQLKMAQNFQTSRRNPCPMDRDTCWVRLWDRTQTWLTPLQCGRRLKAHLQAMLGQELHHTMDWRVWKSRWTHCSSRCPYTDCSAWTFHGGTWWVTVWRSSHLSTSGFPGSWCHPDTRWPPRLAVGVPESLVSKAFHPRPGWLTYSRTSDSL